MPYTLKLSNGNILTTVNDASLNVSTSLTFVGRNYSGYGSVVDQNFVYLLQNFANSTAPNNSIQGQLWYNSNTQQLNVNYNGSNFKSIANLAVNTTQPSNSVVGDLWWNTATNQLSIYTNGSYLAIGPSSDTQSWVYDTTSYTPSNILYCRNPTPGAPIAVISAEAVTAATIQNVSVGSLYSSGSNFEDGLVQGITLSGVVNGWSTKGYYFWGTAATAKVATTANSVAITSNSVASQLYYLPLANTLSGNSPLVSDSGITYQAGILHTTATSAYYADLAERYEADAEYDEGTVLVLGGDKEVTTTNQFADTRVAGIVSKNPAYMMNSSAGNDNTHPYIALKGRVLCKVIGSIKQGDLIVTSSVPGFGCASSSAIAGAIIGKALGSQSEGFGVVEVLVV